MSILTIFLEFSVYSFIGWVCESVFCSILFKKLTNRGFLNGPFCPVYGFGALLLICLLDRLPRNVFIIFIVAVIVTTIVEYITAIILEKLFHAQWWDYSQNFMNFQGRICLVNSLLFGLLALALLFFVEPATRYLIGLESHSAQLWLGVVLIVYFAADFTVTIISMLKLKGRMEALNKIMLAAKEKLDSLSFYNALNFRERIEKLIEDRDFESAASGGSLIGFRERAKQLLSDNEIFQKRIIKAFPEMISTRYPDMLNLIKEKVLGSKRGGGLHNVRENHEGQKQDDEKAVSQIVEVNETSDISK